MSAAQRPLNISFFPHGAISSPNPNPNLKSLSLHLSPLFFCHTYGIHIYGFDYVFLALRRIELTLFLCLLLLNEAGSAIYIYIYLLWRDSSSFPYRRCSQYSSPFLSRQQTPAVVPVQSHVWLWWGCMSWSSGMSRVESLLRRHECYLRVDSIMSQWWG